MYECEIRRHKGYRKTRNITEYTCIIEWIYIYIFETYLFSYIKLV